LLSGRAYRTRANCKSEDVSGKYLESIKSANFALGIIPQTYNQQHNVQKIIIFNENTTYNKFITLDKVNEARIVGSVILSYCEKYPCDSRKKWKFSQLLVGVDRSSSIYSEINSVAELKKLVDWNYTKAYLENQFGVHKIGSKFYTSYKIKDELDEIDTIKYFQNNSTAVNLKNLFEWRKSCFDLYDTMSSTVKKIQSDKTDQQRKFLKFFSSFFINDFQKYDTCHKLIRPASIEVDAEQNWFTSYISGFVHFYQSGYRYSCYDHAWTYNPNENINSMFSIDIPEYRRCKAESLNEMFEHLINAMTTMQHQSGKSFRYIEYDSQPGGTHQKIFSWIVEDNKQQACVQKYPSPEIFPEDIEWKQFSALKITP
jgi:hypothetical protein